jgi:serine/threonine-protein kinase
MSEGVLDRTGETMADRYQITGPLGDGAMASVYKGIDLRTQTDVAIKILKDEVKDRSSFRDRFEREVLITSKVNHATCIHKLDFGERDDGLPYQVMEFVPGRSLADLLDETEMLDPARAMHIFSQLLEALTVCSDAGIIHRDVKPENILIFDRDGQRDCLKLIDFGIAKLIGEAAEGYEKLTSVGLILGTPHYIAPEWVTSEDVDPRADLYSASILLFEMLTSAPPFLSEDRRELMKKHLREPPPTLRDRAPSGNFSPELEAMVAKGLEKDPDKRFNDARAYMDALRALPGGAPGPAQAAQGIVANLPPVGFVAEQGGQAMAEPLADTGPRALTLPPVPRRRINPLMIGGGVALVAGLVVVLSMLDGGDEPVATEGDAGAEVAVAIDAGVVEAPPDAKPPIKVVPITDEQIAPALAAWKEAEMEATDFSQKPDDELANGACRAGEIESLHVLLCVAEFDPVSSRKPMRRAIEKDGKSYKWRSRIKRGDIHLRVETAKRKKKKKIYRRIEKVFKELPK